MTYHDYTAVFEGNETVFINPLKTFGDKLSIPLTVAHYISPDGSAVAFSNQAVSDHMKSFGMDVIQVCGDQLAEEECIEENLGLIVEHQADSEAIEFVELVEEIKLCLHKLGWKYDDFVIEECDDDGEENISVH